MILHLDMDAFFASVEQLDNPALRGKPVIVGGAERGVVSTASYEARLYGIHSAMPMATARKLCPHGVYINVHVRRYSELSKKVMACLHNFSPVVQKASIDEAYLDLGNLAPLATAKAIKRSVAEVTGGLTCSIGIAPVKFLAKICSDINKPDGIFILEETQIDAFLLTLPVKKLPGVGKSMAANLEGLGITTVEQLRRLSREYLTNRYGKFGEAIYDRAFGIDPRVVHENEPAKSESSEHTFANDVRDRNSLEAQLLNTAKLVEASLLAKGNAGRTVTLKIKFSDFRQITRSRTLENRIQNYFEIYEVACWLLNQTPLPRAVRLIGICVSGFEERQEQLFLPGIRRENAQNKNSVLTDNIVERRR